MKSGFSLVELSIVLVILGLLTGGILSGQALIRAAELRSVTTEHQRYVTAVQSFREKYFALPGDMPNAVRFWGAQAGTTANGKNATCAALAAPATGSATCNGNGDGRINFSTTVVSDSYEVFRAWQHLANAGLVEGSFTGVNAASAATPLEHEIGVNSPAARLPNAGWGIRTGGYLAEGATYFSLDYGNELIFGAKATAMPAFQVLRADESWNIDTKIDDGKPGRGKLIANRITLCTTASGPTDYDADYLLTSSNIACSFRFIHAY